MRANFSIVQGILVLAAVTMIWVGCDESDDNEDNQKEGEGTLKLEIWGEDFIEEGSPSDAFADDFNVVFDKFIIALSDIQVSKKNGTAVIDESQSTVWDLTEPGPVSIQTAKAPAGAYTHTAYSVSPATESSVSGNATDAELELMKEGGYALYVEGTASDGSEEYTFKWGFEDKYTFDPCHSKGELAADDTATVQITIHGDHLFYDSAVSENPKLRFADIALADEDGDGDKEVTKDELLKVDISPLDNYGIGSLDIETNLWAYLAHMAGTVGHIDGEGHCD